MINPINAYLQIVGDSAVACIQNKQSADEIIAELQLKNEFLQNAIRDGAKVHAGKVVYLPATNESPYLKLFLRIVKQAPPQQRVNIKIDDINSENLETLNELIECGLYDRVYFKNTPLTTYLLQLENHELLKDILFNRKLFPFRPEDISIEDFAERLDCDKNYLAVMQALREREFPMEKCAFALLCSAVHKQRDEEFQQIWNVWKDACVSSVSASFIDAWNTEENKRFLCPLLQDRRFIRHPDHPNWSHLPTWERFFQQFPPPDRPNINYYLKILSEVLHSPHVDKNFFIAKWSLNQPDWMDNVKKGDYYNPTSPPFTEVGFSYLWTMYPDTHDYLCQYKSHMLIELADTAIQLGIQHGKITALELMKHRPDYSLNESEVKTLLAEVCAFHEITPLQVSWIIIHFSSLLPLEMKVKCKTIFFRTPIGINHEFKSYHGETLLHNLLRHFDLSEGEKEMLQKLIPWQNSQWRIKNSFGFSAIAYAYCYASMFPYIEPTSAESALLCALLSSSTIPWSRLLTQLPIHSLTPLVKGQSTAFHIIRHGILSNFEALGYMLTKEAAEAEDESGRTSLTAALMQKDEKLIERLLDLGVRVNNPDKVFIYRKEWSDSLHAKLIRAGYCPFLSFSFFFSSLSDRPETLEAILQQTTVYQETSPRPSSYEEWVALSDTAPNPLHRLELYAIFNKASDEQWQSTLNVQEVAHYLRTTSSFMRTFICPYLLRPHFIPLEFPPQHAEMPSIPNNLPLSVEELPLDLRHVLFHILRISEESQEKSKKIFAKLATIKYAVKDRLRDQLLLLAVDTPKTMVEHLIKQCLLLCHVFTSHHPAISFNGLAKQLKLPGYAQLPEPSEEEAKEIQRILPHIKNHYLAEITKRMNLSILSVLAEKGHIQEMIPGLVEAILEVSLRHTDKKSRTE